MVWWVELSYPSFGAGKNGFPRTGELIKYYREHTCDDRGKALTQPTLAKDLNLSKQAVWDLENRDVSLDFDRRQFLTQRLHIPPLLLGIVPLDDILKMVGRQHTETKSWWVQLGCPPFAPGKDGFPRTGELVKHYRELKMDDQGHPWTQIDLAHALNITEQAVRDLENKDTSMDFDRRQFLSKWLDIPPILLGIVTLDDIRKMIKLQQEQTAPVVSNPISTSRKLLIDVKEYREQLAVYWVTNNRHTAYSTMTETLLRIDTLYRELPHVRKGEQTQLQELLWSYHQFVANLLRDQQKYDDAITHLNKAFRFAKQMKRDEAKALVLHRRGYILLDAGRIDEAVRDYEEAKIYINLPYNLRGSILLQAGLAGAKAAKDDKVQIADAIALIDLAGNIVRADRKEEDPHSLKLNANRYHLDKGAALIAGGRNKDATNELKLVKCGSEYPRGQAYNDILQAQAHANLGKYELAINLAESGLLVVQKINSVVNINRVEKIYQQLRASPYKDNSGVARLDYLLGPR